MRQKGMLISAEVSREHLKVAGPEHLLAPRSTKQSVESFLIVSGRIDGNDGVGNEHCGESVMNLFDRSRMLHKFERNAVGRFGRLRSGSFTYSDLFTSDCLLNVKDFTTKRARSNVRPRTIQFDSKNCLPEMSEGS